VLFSDEPAARAFNVAEDTQKSDRRKIAHRCGGRISIELIILHGFHLTSAIWARKKREGPWGGWPKRHRKVMRENI
jgi:hypothetical protein